MVGGGGDCHKITQLYYYITSFIQFNWLIFTNALFVECKSKLNVTQVITDNLTSRCSSVSGDTIVSLDQQLVVGVSFVVQTARARHREHPSTRHAERIVPVATNDAERYLSPFTTVTVQRGDLHSKTSDNTTGVYLMSDQYFTVRGVVCVCVNVFRCMCVCNDALNTFYFSVIWHRTYGKGPLR